MGRALWGRTGGITDSQEHMDKLASKMGFDILFGT
jgi:hypothetical protein